VEHRAADRALLFGGGDRERDETLVVAARRARRLLDDGAETTLTTESDGLSRPAIAAEVSALVFSPATPPS
jgi:N-acetylmuramoyl-L-alanine amidase